MTPPPADALWTMPPTRDAATMTRPAGCVASVQTLRRRHGRPIQTRAEGATATTPRRGPTLDTRPAVTDASTTSADPRPPRAPGQCHPARAAATTAALCLFLLLPACATRPAAPPPTPAPATRDTRDAIPDIPTLYHHLAELTIDIDAIDAPRGDVRAFSRGMLRITHEVAQKMIRLAVDAANADEPITSQYARYRVWQGIRQIRATLRRYHDPLSDRIPRDPIPDTATLRRHLDALDRAVTTYDFTHSAAKHRRMIRNALRAAHDRAHDSLDDADAFDALDRPDRADYCRHFAWQTIQHIRDTLRRYTRPAN